MVSNNKTVIGAFGINALHKYSQPSRLPAPRANEFRKGDHVRLYPYQEIHDANARASRLFDLANFVNQRIERNGLSVRDIRRLRDDIDALNTSINEILYGPRFYSALKRLAQGYKPDMTNKQIVNTELSCRRYMHYMAASAYPAYSELVAATKRTETIWKNNYLSKDRTDLIPAAAYQFKLAVEQAAHAARRRGGLPMTG